MRRSILFLITGIFVAATLISAISVYILHDASYKQGDLNHAFAGLFAESVMFAFLVGGTAGLLAVTGRVLFHLTGYVPGAKFSLLLGAGIAVLQYPWDFVARWLLPRFSDLALGVYLVAAVALCTTALLLDSHKQKRAQEFEGVGCPTSRF